MPIVRDGGQGGAGWEPQLACARPSAPPMCLCMMMTIIVIVVVAGMVELLRRTAASVGAPRLRCNWLPGPGGLTSRSLREGLRDAPSRDGHLHRLSTGDAVDHTMTLAMLLREMRMHLVGQ